MIGAIRDSAGDIARRLGAPGVAAAGLIGVAAIVVIDALAGLGAAALHPAPAPAAVPSDGGSDYAARIAACRAQIDGRTMFFIPDRPPPPPPVVEARGDDRPPPPPAPPSSYGGPAPIGMVNDTVWLADGRRLKAGEEARGDVEVVRLDPPWSAVLRWKGAEFTVKVFDRDSVVMKPPGAAMAEGTPPPPKPPSEPEAPAPAAEPPPAEVPTPEFEPPPDMQGPEEQT